MKELREISFTWERGTAYNYGWLDGVKYGVVIGILIGAAAALIVVNF